MSDCRECGLQAHKCVCADAQINRLIAALDRLALPAQLDKPDRQPDRAQNEKTKRR